MTRVVCHYPFVYFKLGRERRNWSQGYGVVWSHYLITIILVLTFGCGQPQHSPTSSPTPDAIAQQISKGQESLTADDYESAALAYREALDLIEEQGGSHPELEAVSANCTRAMMEAGGYYSSRRLWSEMKAKNPDAGAEAQRMVNRAEKFMRMQAEELLKQAKLDQEEGHALKAKATANASLRLFEELPKSEEPAAQVREFIKSL